MRLDVKRQLFARSERVKGIDFHPTEPWILTTLYSGHVYIWSYETQVSTCARLVRLVRFLG
jgi:coatomer subunit beta'